MKLAVRVAHAFDRVSDFCAWLATWMVLLACVISAGNATVRYLVDRSSNAWLEVQWYLFAGMVLLGASQVLRLNEHVRVDIIYGNLQPRHRAWIDLVGLIVFLMPSMLVTAWMSWPFFAESWAVNEASSNAGGLVRWPVKLLIPVGFGLVSLQGASEIIKRLAFLFGDYRMDTQYARPLQ